jgi:hypothetical protein
VSYKRAQIARQLERVERALAERRPMDTRAAAQRLDAAIQAHVHQCLGAHREGGEPLPREITPEIEQDRATLRAGLIPGEIEANAGRFHRLLERIAQNLAVSEPLNAERLTGEAATVTHAEAGQAADADPERVRPTSTLPPVARPLPLEGWRDAQDRGRDVQRRPWNLTDYLKRDDSLLKQDRWRSCR